MALIDPRSSDVDLTGSSPRPDAPGSAEPLGG